MSWQVVILRGTRGEEGPFTEEEILDLLDAGEVTRDDWCRVEGQPHEQRLGELFQTISPRGSVAAVATQENAPPGEAESTGLFPDLARTDADDAEETEDSDDSGLDPVAEADEDAPEEAIEDGEFDEVSDDDADETRDNDVETAEGGDFGDAYEEQLLFVGCPSWFNYWKIFGLVACVLAIGYWAGAYGGWWLGAALALAFLLLGRAFINRASHEYCITTERVESTTGILSKTSREIRLDDIRAINVLQNGLLGLLGIGTVIFSSVGGPEDDVIFAGVRRAHYLKHLVRDWQRRGA